MDKIIPKHLRHLDKFTHYAVGRAVKPRMENLLIPADFSLSGDHGVYLIDDQRDSGCGILISFRHDKDMGIITLKEELTGSLELEDNWSKMGASLRERDGEKIVVLCQLFSFKIDMSKEEVKQEEDAEQKFLEEDKIDNPDDKFEPGGDGADSVSFSLEPESMEKEGIEKNGFDTLGKPKRRFARAQSQRRLQRPTQAHCHCLALLSRAQPLQQLLAWMDLTPRRRSCSNSLPSLCDTEFAPDSFLAD